MVAEYIYVDQKRLNSYFEQVSSPVKYEKISVWGFEWSITGPKASGSQSRPSRPYTEHEKISTVLANLSRLNAPSATEQSRSIPDFEFSALVGVRAFIPPEASLNPSFKGLALWLCHEMESFNGQFDIYLIEDFRKQDELANLWSGNSALWMLLGELPKGISNHVISAPIDTEVTERRIEGPASLFDELSRPEGAIVKLQAAGYLTDAATAGRFSRYMGRLSFEVRDRLNRYECEVIGPESAIRPPSEQANKDKTVILLSRDKRMEAAARFATDPKGVLKEWGAAVGPERKIDSLYRIRHVMIEESVEDHRSAVIGYPIFVVDHPSPFSKANAS